MTLAYKVACIKSNKAFCRLMQNNRKAITVINIIAVPTISSLSIFIHSFI